MQYETEYADTCVTGADADSITEETTGCLAGDIR
jgi:hypothetical protein